MEERKTVIIHINSNDPGIVIDIARILKNRRLPPKCKVTPDTEARTITIEGTDKVTVEKAMGKYAKGFKDGAGHGGFRLKYEVEEVVVSEREILEGQIRAEVEGEIAATRRKQADLEQKWGAERKSLVNALAGQQRTFKQLRKTLVDMEGERDRAQSKLAILATELSGSRMENEEFRRQRRAMQRTPLHKIVFRRLARFVRR